MQLSFIIIINQVSKVKNFFCPLGFDVTAFLREHTESCKTPEYLDAVKNRDTTYEAMEAGALQHRELLAQDREMRRKAIRYQAAACAAHGFEWTVSAQGRAGSCHPESAIKAFFCAQG